MTGFKRQIDLRYKSLKPGASGTGNETTTAKQNKSNWKQKICYF